MIAVGRSPVSASIAASAAAGFADSIKSIRRPVRTIDSRRLMALRRRASADLVGSRIAKLSAIHRPRGRCAATGGAAVHQMTTDAGPVPAWILRAFVSARSSVG